MVLSPGAPVIVVPEGGQLRLVTQPDHAHFAAELLSLWRSPELVEHPRRRQLLRAVREHDNGWREADSAPRVDPVTGAPHTFLDLPADERREIWRRGTRRHAADAPYVALLVTEHALALFSDRAADGVHRELLEELQERRAELLEASGLEPKEVAADYRWLDLADTLSLAACSRWAGPIERQGWRGELRGDTLELAPFPLAGATTFQVPCRRIPDRPWAGDAELGAALATARWERFAVRVVAGAQLGGGPPADPCRTSGPG